jgi:hypothetical protein
MAPDKSGQVIHGLILSGSFFEMADKRLSNMAKQTMKWSNHQ